MRGLESWKVRRLKGEKVKKLEGIMCTPEV